MRTAKFAFIFLIVIAWIYSGWPQVWQNPPVPLNKYLSGPFPPKIQKAWAAEYSEIFTTSTTWIAPPGITTTTVEAWGAGGGGDTNSANNGGGGGGGGAYAKATVTVTPGTGYFIRIGSGGAANSALVAASSSFATTSVFAAGGTGRADITSGPGGSVTNSSGTIKFQGGAGGAGSGNDGSGGGGGAGGPDGAGATSTSATTSAGTTGGNGDAGSGGAGGAGGAANNVGQPGSSNALGGGGGGGAGDNSTGGLGGAPGGGGGGGGAGGARGANGQVKVTYTIFTILGNAASEPSNVTIGPGGSITDLDNFTLQNTTSTDTVTALVVTLGPAGAYNNISQVDITNTSNVAQCTAVTGLTSDTVTFPASTCTIPVTTSETTFKVRITPKSHTNMPSPSSGASYDTTGTVTSYTSTNVQTGSDTGSATVTVDNGSPANVTNASGTAANAQVTLSWTNPGDSDFTTTTVLRATSTIGSTAPAEGTNYATSSTVNATTTVACVVAGGAGNPVSCVDTGLTNNTAYHYKIFAQDSSGNYATGAVPTGSPFTPVNQTVSCNTDVSSVSFGTLSTASVSTASPNASTTMDCTYSLGCTLNISDAGNGSNPGLATTSPAYLIQSNTATLSAGTEGYGIQAATTGTGSGATLGLNSTYNKSGNDVGGLSLSTTVLASSTASFTNREVVVTHKAAISVLTNTASYRDTITYSCTGN